jgi:hypothetical protein
MTHIRHIPPSAATTAVLWWVSFYTRSVPAHTAQERRDELLSDIYEQLADGRQRNLSRGSIDRAVASRALRGVPADLSWSRKERQRKEKTMNTPQVTREPANGPIMVRLSSVGWAVLALVALIGFATSITELVDYGGARFGYVPWPGAGNINVTLVQLVGSVVLLVPAAVVSVKRLAQHHYRNA